MKYVDALIYQMAEDAQKLTDSNLPALQERLRRSRVRVLSPLRIGSLLCKREDPMRGASALICGFVAAFGTAVWLSTLLIAAPAQTIATIAQPGTVILEPSTT